MQHTHRPAANSAIPTRDSRYRVFNPRLLRRLASRNDRFLYVIATPGRPPCGRSGGEAISATERSIGRYWAAAVALAWTIRNGNVIAIPESGSAEHVKENAVALSLILTPDELDTLDAAYPPSNR